MIFKSIEREPFFPGEGGGERGEEFKRRAKEYLEVFENWGRSKLEGKIYENLRNKILPIREGFRLDSNEWYKEAESLLKRTQDPEKKEKVQEILNRIKQQIEDENKISNRFLSRQAPSLMPNPHAVVSEEGKFTEGKFAEKLSTILLNLSLNDEILVVRGTRRDDFVHEKEVALSPDLLFLIRNPNISPYPIIAFDVVLTQGKPENDQVFKDKFVRFLATMRDPKKEEERGVELSFPLTFDEKTKKWRPDLKERKVPVFIFPLIDAPPTLPSRTNVFEKSNYEKIKDSFLASHFSARKTLKKDLYPCFFEPFFGSFEMQIKALPEESAKNFEKVRENLKRLVDEEFKT